MREQGRWHMAWPPALWSGPPFPASPVHGLMNFPLEKCLCLVMSSMTGASAVTDSLPPPSWHREYLSLLVPSTPPWAHKCLVCICTGSPSRQEQILLAVASVSQGKAVGVKYSVLITEVLLSSFSNTGDIYKILSNILGAPLWIYIW